MCIRDRPWGHRDRVAAGASAIADSSILRFFLVSSFGSVEVFGALHPLNGPALLAQQQAQSLVADNRRPPLGDHPLATRYSASFGRLQRRNRQPVIGGPTPGDLGDLGALVGAEGRRAAAPVARAERVKPVGVEVVDHVADPVRAGAGHLGDAAPACPGRTAATISPTTSSTS